MAARDPRHQREMASTGDVPRARAAGPATRSDGRHGHPLAGALIWVVTVIVAAPVLRILIEGVTAPALSVSGVISSVLLLLGLPVGAIGLYGLVTGARRAYGGPPHHAWLRPPMAYIPIALVLFIAAGLAAS
jgi:hypothetical protein